METSSAALSRRSRDPELAGPALRAFFRLADAWKLTVPEQLAALGGISRATLYKWRANPASAQPGSDRLDRISYLLGIYRALHTLFSRPEQADSWIRRPNDAPPFGSKDAAALMFGSGAAKIEDLARVRRYLDAASSSW